MSKVISISNHKGGVGKTTSAINIGAGIAQLKKRVLLIDLDPQANLSESLGIVEPESNIYQAITGEQTVRPIEIFKGLELIPATLDLSGAEVELSSEMGREYRLKRVVEALRGSYDFIFIDTPPSLGLLTINAFTASDEVYIPLQAHYLALRGLSKLTEVIDRVKDKLNPQLTIGGVFITLYDSRKVLNRNVVEAIEANFGEKVFNTRIRENISLAEAPTQEMDIYRYSPKSYGEKNYLSLCKEILSKQHKHNKHNKQKH